MRNILAKLKTVLLGLLLLASAMPGKAQSPIVDFVPLPVNSVVNDGDNFSVTIEVQTNGQPTAGAEVHLDFDPTYLEVVSLSAGTTLPIPLIAPVFNNAAGTIDYAGGTFSTTPPTGSFALLTINFEAKAAVGSTSVTYSTLFPRATAASVSGASVLNEAIPFAVTIIGVCNIAASGLSNIQCNDNGTPSDPSDDYFTFDLNPTGANLGAGYSVSNVSGTSTGVYGGASSFATAPGTAGNGNLNITITDNSALGCTLAETVTDPGTCSNTCNLVSSGLSNIQCNDNGTPGDPSDDYFTFDLNSTGANLGAGYSVSNVSGTSTGVYGGVSSFATAPGTAGNGDLNITITDNSFAACTLAETVTDPGTCSSGNPLTLILGSESEFACGSILIPVTVENYTDILGGQGTISWNNAVLNFVGTQQYGIPDISVGSFNALPGQLIFSYNDASIDQLGQTLPDDAILFVIEFNVVGALGSNTSIDFTNAGTNLLFFDAGLSILAPVYVSGSVDVPASTSLSGQAFSELGSAVPGVTFNLSGGDGPQSQTGNPGFDFTITPCAEDEIGAFKNNDLDADNGINTLDIIFIQRHILGIAALPTAYKLIAADVNGSASINVLDILFVRQMILQQRTKFPEPGGLTGLADGTRLWAFVPSDYVFANPAAPWPFDTSRVYTEVQARTNQNFIGMKLGDVNNSWDPSTLRIAAVDDVVFQLAEVNGLPGGEVVVPVTVKDFDQIAGFQFTISWDPSLLSLNEVAHRDLEAHFGMQAKQAGKLTVSWNESNGAAISLPDGSVVFELRMSLKGNWGSQASLSIGSDLTTSEAYNDQFSLLNIIAFPGHVNIGNATTGFDPALNDGYGLFQNIPNPFDRSTLLVFELPKAEEVEIHIFNALGQHIRTFKDSYAAGVHELRWDGMSEDAMEVSDGIYYAKMNAGAFSGMVRMHKLN